MNTIIRSIWPMVLILGLQIPGLSFADDQQAAIDTVESLHSALLDVMKNAQSLGYKGRVEKLDPVVGKTFNFATIARIVTGKHWKKVDEAQRESFLEVFSDLSSATYASNFNGYSGESFKTIEAEERRGKYIVKSVIVKSDGEEISLDYVLTKNEDMWQIVNVIAQGVSDLSLKRADYTAAIDSEGFDSLINKLSEKIKDYQSH